MSRTGTPLNGNKNNSLAGRLPTFYDTYNLQVNPKFIYCRAALAQLNDLHLTYTKSVVDPVLLWHSPITQPMVCPVHVP